MVPAVLEKEKFTNTAQIVNETFSPVHQGLSNLSDLEDGWGLDVIPGNKKVVKEVKCSGTVLFHSPVLPGERINDLLLNTLLASNLEALVFAYSHLLYFWKRHNCDT